MDGNEQDDESAKVDQEEEQEDEEKEQDIWHFTLLAHFVPVGLFVSVIPGQARSTAYIPVSNIHFYIMSLYISPRYTHSYYNP